MTDASAAATAAILHTDLHAGPDTTTTIVSQFLAVWERAWKHHAAEALGHSIPRMQSA